MSQPVPVSLHIAALIVKHLKEELPEAELAELQRWIASSEENRKVWEEITNPVLQQHYVQAIAKYDPEQALNRFLRKHKQPVHRIPSARRWVWIAAASVMLLLATGAYFLFLGPGKKSPVSSQSQLAQDIEPGKEGAILTLADGTRVILDSLGNGIIATQKGAQVVLHNGQLTYQPRQMEKKPGEEVYNTMTTPKGRQFRLTLPDGTMVWLNAASSLRYPTQFTGNERRVEITGEAYFEVTSSSIHGKDGGMPFIVQTKNQEIQVLGTSFNVNSYSNENLERTTLVQGRVRVMRDGESRTLGQGEQAILSSGSESSRAITVQTADIEKVMAWKNGNFNFNDASLEEVMRQLERWYDIEVSYEKGVPGNVYFVGKMSRSLKLSTLLEVLATMDVHFRIEKDRRLVVLP